MKNNVVLFDIDYTLFDAKTYREKFLERFAGVLNHEPKAFLEVANQVYDQARTKSINFDPDIFLTLLMERINRQVAKDTFLALLQEESIIAACVYPDVVQTLEALSKYAAITIGIFSAGKPYIQSPKIASLAQYLAKQHVHIYDQVKVTTLTDLFSHYTPDDSIYIVDDVLPVLAEAKRVRPETVAIWVKRGEFLTPGVANFTPDSIIRTLPEVVPLVTR